MASKKYFKVYGKVNGVEYLLGTIFSLCNADIFAESMMLAYSDVWVDK